MTDPTEGPIWQLQQQVKHFEGVAASNRAEANKSFARADHADVMAQQYRDALKTLKEAAGG